MRATRGIRGLYRYIAGSALLLCLAGATPSAPAGRPEPGKAPVQTLAPSIATPALKSKLDAMDDVFDVNALGKALTLTPEQQKMLSAKVASLTVALKPLVSISEELNLLRVDYRYVSPRKYRLLLLFRVRQDMRPARIGVGATVDISHMRFLTGAEKENGYAGWMFPPPASDLKWLKGKTVILDEVVSAPPVPMNLKLRLSEPKTGVYRSPLVDLGWVADVAKPPSTAR